MATFNITGTIIGNGVTSPVLPIVVNEGGDQIVNFTPDAGWAIENVSVDGYPLGAVTSHEFTEVFSDYVLEITFAEVPLVSHTIQVQDNIAGIIAPGGAVSVVDGGNQILTVTPSSGYALVDWVIDTIPEPATSNQYAFINVRDNHTIGANLERLPNYSARVKLMQMEPISVKRRNFAEGSYNEAGYREAGPEFQVFTVLANVQPGQTQSGMLQAVGEQVRQDNDYDYIDKSWKIFTYDQIQSKDVFILEDGDYEVLDVDDWSRFNLNSVNYRSMARKIKDRGEIDTSNYLTFFGDNLNMFGNNIIF